MAEGLFGLGKRFCTRVLGGETDRPVRLVVDHNRRAVVTVDTVFDSIRAVFEPHIGDIGKRDDLFVPNRPQTERGAEIPFQPGRIGIVPGIRADPYLPVVGLLIDFGDDPRVDTELRNTDFEGVFESVLQWPVGLHYLIELRIRSLSIERPPTCAHYRNHARWDCYCCGRVVGRLHDAVSRPDRRPLNGVFRLAFYRLRSSPQYGFGTVRPRPLGAGRGLRLRRHHLPPRHRRARCQNRLRPPRGPQRLPPGHGRRTVHRPRSRPETGLHRLCPPHRQRPVREGRRLGLLLGWRPVRAG